MKNDVDFSIRLTNLSKIYSADEGRTPAIESLTLSVTKGQVFGILGSNEAGKTTLIKMLAGLIKPTGGQILLNDYDLTASPTEALALKQVSLVLEDQALPFPNATIMENLEQSGQDDPLTETREVQVRQILGQFSLWEQRHTPTNILSHGVQRRLLLAIALRRNPSIILLDEPLTSLDRGQMQMIKSWLIRLAHEYGKTIVLTTRYPEVARGLCDHVAVLNRGRLIKSQPVQEMPRLFQEFYQIKVKGHLTHHWQHRFDNLIIKNQENGETTLYGHVTDQAALHSVITGLRDLGMPLLSITRVEPNLANVLDCLMYSEHVVDFQQR